MNIWERDARRDVEGITSSLVSLSPIAFGSFSCLFRSHVSPSSSPVYHEWKSFVERRRQTVADVSNFVPVVVLTTSDMKNDLGRIKPKGNTLVIGTGWYGRRVDRVMGLPTSTIKLLDRLFCSAMKYLFFLGFNKNSCMVTSVTTGARHLVLGTTKSAPCCVEQEIISSYEFSYSVKLVQ